MLLDGHDAQDQIHVQVEVDHPRVGYEVTQQNLRLSDWHVSSELLHAHGAAGGLVGDADSEGVGGGIQGEAASVV